MSLGKFPCVHGFGLVRLQRMLKMPSTRLPRVLFFAIILAAMVQCIHDFPLLPDRLASHFGPSGAANGWMTKSQFFITYAVVLLPALFVEFWLHRKVANTPEGKLRLPNKEYWLAPERRADTIAYFQSFFAWYGCAFLFIEVFAMGLAMRANLNDPPLLPTGPVVTVLFGFILFNIFAVVAMLRHFSLPS